VPGSSAAALGRPGENGTEKRAGGALGGKTGTKLKHGAAERKIFDN